MRVSPGGVWAVPISSRLLQVADARLPWTSQFFQGSYERLGAKTSGGRKTTWHKNGIGHDVWCVWCTETKGAVHGAQNGSADTLPVLTHESRPGRIVLLIVEYYTTSSARNFCQIMLLISEIMLTKWLRFCNRVRTLFWTKNSRPFQGHIFHFSRTPCTAQSIGIMIVFTRFLLLCVATFLPVAYIFT